ncbi:hypothetical protein [Sphingosinicella terrae]|uniref:hypothetical protein n=1 Tax=Sphingosinicella terrae TaxID=2172047 RepID=UPI000E0CEBB5|nr:hypothetical protein [Sphingosinicella terrae]
MRILATGLFLISVAAPAAEPLPADCFGGPAAATPADIPALAGRCPASHYLQLRLLGAAREAGDAASADAVLRRLAAMGYAPAAADAFAALAPLIGETEAAAFAGQAQAARRPIEASIVLSHIPAEHRLVEGIAWDPVSRRLFASAVVGRYLLSLSEQGWAPVPDLGAGSLIGVAVDRPRQLLWVASRVVEQTPSPEGAFRGLLAVDLESRRLVRRVAAPEGTGPGDIAIGPDGTVFASDPTGGGLYRLAPGAETMEAVVPPGRLRSPQGIAVAADGRRLYVSDYGRGIAIVDPESGTVADLVPDAPMMLSGTDGLMLHGGDLIAIQNGTEPRRIVRIRLDAGGTRATALEVIEQAHREWGEPTIGQIDGDRLLYVSDAQWERFGAGGRVTGEAPLRATAIRAVPLGPPPASSAE